MTLALIVVAVLFLSYSNGANDNFKGVATLHGSATASYDRALKWATATTFAGSLAAVFFGAKLVKAFSGKGLVPEALTEASGFRISVGLAAAITVFLATRFGFPISTTHALTGALVGAGLMAVGSEVNVHVLGKAFALPLLVSPLAAILLTMTIYPVLRAARTRLGVTRETCVCVGSGVIPLRLYNAGGAGSAVAGGEAVTATVDSTQKCVERYQGSVAGFSAQAALDVLHYLAAGLVSFARGFNDTPKIAGLLLGLSTVGSGTGMTVAGMLGIGVAMAIGGWLHAHRVAKTMSSDITSMNPGQGFTANAITGFLVLAASALGLPVSTTHVTCGALFGIGSITGQAKWNVIGQILLAWVTTLPVAATLGGVIYAVVGKM